MAMSGGSRQLQTEDAVTASLGAARASCFRSEAAQIGKDTSGCRLTPTPPPVNHSCVCSTPSHGPFTGPQFALHIFLRDLPNVEGEKTASAP